MAIYPSVCLQNLIEGAWWEEYSGPEYRPGRLIWTFVPYIDQDPLTLIPVERGGEDGTQHASIVYELKSLSIKRANRQSTLPTAALPHRKNELNTVYRAKKRPAIIIGKSGKKVDKDFTIGMASYQTKLTVLVAPSYGAGEEGRSGFPPQLVERIKRCEYPQFMWDKLPIPSRTQESIIRFDQLQPVGKSTDSLEFTNYCLSEEALGLVYEWLEWLMTGELDADSDFNEYRDCLLTL